MDKKDFPSISTKWAGCLMTGRQLTKEQTFYIISKCDPMLQANISNLGFGNNHTFIQNARDFTLLNQLSDDLVYEYNEQHLDELGLQNISYSPFRTSLLSSSWIGGADSWLLKDGTIFYHANIGSWSSTNDVIEYWTTMATAFPFLDLNMTIFNCELSTPIIVIQNHLECDETIPVSALELDDEVKEEALFNLSVKDGKVTVSAPNLTVHNGKIPLRKHLMQIRKPNPSISECYLDTDMVTDLLNHTRQNVIQFVQNLDKSSKSDNSLYCVSLILDNKAVIQFVAKNTDILFHVLKNKTCGYFGKKKIHDFNQKMLSADFKNQPYALTLHNPISAIHQDKLDLEDGFVLHIEPFDFERVSFTSFANLNQFKFGFCVA